MEVEKEREQKTPKHLVGLKPTTQEEKKVLLMCDNHSHFRSILVKDRSEKIAIDQKTTQQRHRKRLDGVIKI